MTKVVSEDAIGRAFKAIDEAEGAARLARSSGVLRGAVACRTVACRAVDPRCRYDDQAALRPSGRSGSYNPKKPGRPSHCRHTYSMASTRLVFDVDVSPGDEHTSKHGAQARRARPVGVPRPSFARAVAGAVARRQRLRQRRRHARGGGAPASLSLQTASDPERPAHDREALRARVGQRGPGVLGQAERGSPGRLEPPAAHDRAQAASEGGDRALLRRRDRDAAAHLRKRSARRPMSTNTRSSSPRSTKRQSRSASAIATGGTTRTSSTN